MDKIILHSRQIYTTSIKNTCIDVKKGHVLIHMVCVDAKSNGRRYYIGEIKSEDCLKIPSLLVDTNESGNWRFIISSLGDSEIEICELSSDEYIDIASEFIEKLKIKSVYSDSFENDMVEMIQCKLVKENMEVFLNKKGQEQDRTSSIKAIYNALRNSQIEYRTKTTDKLYNAVFAICSKYKIRVLPYEEVVKACGKNFKLDDIARVSHFMIREVHLDDGWFKNDSGALLVYKQSSDTDYCIPVACIPKNVHQYMEYNYYDNEVRLVDTKVDNSYVRTAYMIYKPLPAMKMTLLDIVQFIRGSYYISDNILSLFLIFVTTIIGIFIPYLSQLVYDKYILLGDKNELLQIGALILSFTIGNLLFSIVKYLAIFRSNVGIERTLQAAVYDRLFDMPEHIYDEYNSADLVSRSMSITNIITKIFSNYISSIISAGFGLIYIVVMYLYSPVLTGIGVSLVAIQIIISLAIGYICAKFQNDIVIENVKSNSMINQIILGIEKIKIAGAQERFLYKFIESYIKSKKKYEWKTKLLYISKNINIMFITLYIITFYNIMISSGLGLSIGYFLAFYSAFGAFLATANKFSDTIFDYLQLRPSIDKARLIFETIPEHSGDIKSVGKLNGKIDISNVSFRYKENEPLVLSDVNIGIDAGEYVGIVGASGSGKSTLFRILMGFNVPTMGKIYYDNKEIESFDKREMRKNFGVVLQDGSLIMGSIYENIAVASNAVTPNEHKNEIQRVKHIIKIVGLEEDIAKMPMGLETVVSDDGSSISGGQKQRVLIARAIFNNPAILFFDEATSALDNHNQSLIADNLNKLKVTRVVVAHRLSTVIDCDKIIVLDKGKVIETGTYNELMDQKGLFYRMALRQLA